MTELLQQTFKPNSNDIAQFPANVENNVRNLLGSRFARNPSNPFLNGLQIEKEVDTPLTSPTKPTGLPVNRFLHRPRTWD